MSERCVQTSRNFQIGGLSNRSDSDVFSNHGTGWKRYHYRVSPVHAFVISYTSGLVQEKFVLP